MNFKIGCDPEVFVRDQNGYRSIIETIGGSKDFPRPLDELGKGFCVQEDNVAMEFNIPASSSKGEFITNVVKARLFLDQLVRDQYGWFMSSESAVIFPEEELQHPMAKVFGCDPDYNAWNKRPNPRPKAANARLRSCGGHVHVGADLTEDQKWALGQAMDFYLGVPSVLMDKGEARKELYGKAGAMRLKSYGMEYRTLSNFWIFDQRLIGWVYEQTAKAVQAVEVGTSFKDLRKTITNCINNNDKQLAQLLVDEYELTTV